MNNVSRLAVAAWWGLALAPPLCGQDAVLAGRVVAVPRVYSKPSTGGGVYADRSLMFSALFDYDHLKNVVVYAEPISSAALPSPDTSAAANFTVQKKRSALALTPDFLAVSRDDPIRFTNQTGADLTLFAAGDLPVPFSIEVGPHKNVEVHFPAFGLYKLRCLEDPGLQAKLFVAGGRVSPAGPDGRYTLALPAGRYKVTAWHERLPPQTREVDFPSSGAQDVNFSLSVRQLPEVQ